MFPEIGYLYQGTEFFQSNKIKHHLTQQEIYRFLTRLEHVAVWFHPYSVRLICLEYGPQFSNDAATRVRVWHYLWDQSVAHIGGSKCKLPAISYYRRSL